ncbi:carbon-nitrogen hydrolase family protein [Kocuria rosea]|uniref:carbon-nitrogen hydrolase family protein n=1 Tax=Kocuria rosea TaxID=1275 RepID=UPI00203D06D2|nr:carbon-nitrogen hydrolase family protein [Kocuria rosea]
MTRPLSLALVQAPTQPDNDIAAFSTRLEQLARFHTNTRLFVYPEFHLTGLGDGDPAEAEAMIEDLAEPVDGPRGRTLAQLAGDLGIWLVPGSFYERGADGRIYNTTVVYSPHGDLVASYRKVFPWRPYETIAQGSGFVVFDIEGTGRVGLSICYDAWFPEVSRHLAWMGAELILNVVQTPTADREQEMVLARANAIVNQVFVASVNAAYPDGAGRSLLVDPQGRVRMSSESSESRVLTDFVDLDEVTNVRTYGTGGVTRPWAQFDGIDEGIELPLYNGRIDPAAWRIQSTPGAEHITATKATDVSANKVNEESWS